MLDFYENGNLYVEWILEIHEIQNSLFYKQGD